MEVNMKLSLGPILYYWPREALFEFYETIAGTSVDIVYLGEAVCSRRHAFRFEDWLDVAKGLSDAGKEVVLSTQTLIESESDLKALRRLAENGEFALEANDMGAVRLLSGKSFVAGPHLNAYSPETLEILVELGARRWVIPIEMSKQALSEMRPESLETEVLVHGRLPLAFSARCFTARHYNLPKDDCRFSCLDHPFGLELKTREGEPFLALNGIQTQSYRLCNLIGELDEMRKLGVSIARISPQPMHMEETISLFRGAIDGKIRCSEASSLISDLVPVETCNGYWQGSAGMEYMKGVT